MNSSKPLQGKTVLITGGTDGIGKYTAKVLAGLGGDIAIVGRNIEKTQNTVKEIQDQSGHTIDHFIADLSDMSQVQRLGEDILAKYSQLDVLINNAGALFFRRKETVDRYERTFALNHLAYFYLTEQLMELIKSTPSSRIINVASAAHFPGEINFDDVMFEKGYRGRTVYSQSKLANVMHTYTLSRRLKDSGVTVNALHPGFVRTNFARDNGLLVKMLQPLGFLSAIPVEQGAETMIYLAMSNEVDGVSGKYFTLKKTQRSSDLSYDKVAQEKLWDLSKTLVTKAIGKS